MYREDGWIEGHYIDNHVKYECRDCEREFIVGEKLLEDAPLGYPVCPYCGQSNVERMSWTEDDQLADLGSEMGCLAIYIDDKKAEWVNHNACRFCAGSRFHSCTIYDCRPAVNSAEEYYNNILGGDNVDKQKAIDILQKHIDTYKHQLTDAGWYEMVRMGIVRPTVKERLLYSADADEQISAYETAIEALKKTMSEGDKNVDTNSK